MLRLLFRPVALHGPAYYILTRGLVLAGLLLLSALTLAVSAQGLWLAGWYCRYLQTAAATLAGTALMGALLVEDVIRRAAP